jgi:D-alanyl-D-alanine carboxypeptidase/D-alanyl-D-alanine-endopeptidase (penicillin-binding protein 4)
VFGPLLAVSLSPSALAQTSICPAQLPSQINAILDQPSFQRARWGVLVQTLVANPSQRQTLYDREAQRLFIPASNVKVFTTAAALQRLGGQHRIRTSIWGQRSQQGDWILRLVGQGDPSLSDAQLRDLAQQLKQQGIQQVAQFHLDDSYYAGEVVNPTWEWGDLQAGYGAVANSLIVNQNTTAATLTPQKVGQPLQVRWHHPEDLQTLSVENLTMTVAAQEPEFVSISRDIDSPVLRLRGQLRVGAEPETLDLAIANPVAVLRSRLQQALSAAKVTVQHWAVASAPAPGQRDQEVAFVESPPLAKLIQETNQDSNNLYAETLLKRLGILARTPVGPGEPATDVGIKTVSQVLEPLGVDASGYQLVDGSGLSRMNLASPAALVQTLQAMAAQPTSRVYRASLAVAGASGTLTNRLRGASTQGIVQAKTGTLTGAIALSGYIAPPQYPPLAFSIVLNHAMVPLAVQRQAIDDIVVLLAHLHTCP